MNRSTRIGLLIVLLISASVSPTPAATLAQDVRQRLERIAANLPWLVPHDALYQRDPHPYEGPNRQLVIRLTTELYAPYRLVPTSAPTTAASQPSDDTWMEERGTLPLPDDVRPLLNHQNPKVRTLAILLLFSMDRIDVMPDIAALANDSAPTFPMPQSARTSSVMPSPDPMLPVTVADYVHDAIERYQHESNELENLWRQNGLPADAPGLTKLFADLSSRRDPMLNTATLRVAMGNATGGTHPVPGERDNRVYNVLARAEKMPMPRRFFVMLALDMKENGADRYPPDYLLSLARLLPRQLRLDAIAGHPDINDPDVPPGWAAGFLLDNAVHLLQPRDVQFLVKLDAQALAAAAEHKNQSYANSAAIIAAARLAPDRASNLLIDALSARGHGEQADRIAAALAELGDEKDVRRAVDWFFEIVPERGSFGGGREEILGRLESASPTRYRRFVALLCRDQRLATLGPASSRMLIEAAQGYFGRQLATEDQIRDSYGIDESQRDRKLTCLSDWHRALKETVDEWDPQGP